MSYKEKKRIFLELRNEKCVEADLDLLMTRYALLPRAYVINPRRHADAILFLLLDIVPKEEIIQHRADFYRPTQAADSEDEPNNEPENEPEAESQDEKVETAETHEKHADKAEKRAKEAEKRAEEAEKRADEAEIRADEAEGRAEEESERADEAEERADEAEERATVAEEALEQEKKKG